MINKKLLTVILGTLISTSLWAGSSLYGPTGLITMPTAESLKYREVSLSYDYLFAKDKDNDSWYHKINLGTFKNWEIGIVGGKSPEEGVFVNAKYYLMSDNARYPFSVALGIENLTSDDQTGVYMVASKKFQGGLSGHFGFKAVFADTLDPSAMVGLEYFVNNQLALLTDITGQEETYIINAAAHYYLLPGLSLRATVVDATSATKDGSLVGLGIAFSRYI